MKKQLAMLLVGAVLMSACSDEKNSEKTSSCSGEFAQSYNAVIFANRRFEKVNEHARKTRVDSDYAEAEKAMSEHVHLCKVFFQAHAGGICQGVPVGGTERIEFRADSLKESCEFNELALSRRRSATRNSGPGAKTCYVDYLTVFSNTEESMLKFKEALDRFREAQSGANLEILILATDKMVSACNGIESRYPRRSCKFTQPGGSVVDLSMAVFKEDCETSRELQREIRKATGNGATGLMNSSIDADMIQGFDAQIKVQSLAL